MFKNYFKVGLRNLLRNKGLTAINIAGLSVGLATCLLIILYVADELSFDRYNLKAVRIYRANLEVKFGNNKNMYAAVPSPLAAEAKKDFPAVEQSVRLLPTYDNPGGFMVKKGNNAIKEKNVIYADASLFDVFTFSMVEGNPSSALAGPRQMVITESIAKKYFNTTHVVGQALTFNDSIQYKITGVIKDIPGQSHFAFDFFLSMKSLPDSIGGWGGGGFNTYVLVKPGADIKTMEKKLSDIAFFNNRDWLGKNDYLRIALQPLTTIHLHSGLQQELGRNGSIQYVYIFSAVAFIILLIACVNFVNLSTARSASRAREVGVRKVLGSPRKYLIAQFLTESFIVTSISTIIAISMAWMALPLFNQVSGKQISFTAHTFGWMLPAALAVVAVVGCAAGLYPAFFLSAFKPVDVLKGKLSKGFKGGGLRSFLVVLQFSISVFLIIGTVVIFNQLNYIKTTNPGYSRSQVLIIKNTDGLKNEARAFKQKLMQLPGVASASLTPFVPLGSRSKVARLFPDAKLETGPSMLTEFWPVDENYLTTLGISLKAGRDFSTGMKTDSSAVIINEAAAKFLGFKDPVNKIIYRNAYGAGLQTFKVIGVIKDFHFKPLHDKISPLVLYLNEDRGALSVKINSTKITALMDAVERDWKEFAPYQHFDYSFMDADFDAAYSAENRAGKIFTAFTFFAIAIACLGLFGLAAYSTEQRTKEVGIRKVLGADVTSLILLLTKDFIKLVCVAILIATPIATLAMQQWLNGFAYRTDIHWWVAGVAGLAAILIAFATVSLQSIKAALANPVKSLKAE